MSVHFIFFKKNRLFFFEPLIFFFNDGSSILQHVPSAFFSRTLPSGKREPTSICSRAGAALEIAAGGTGKRVALVYSRSSKPRSAEPANPNSTQLTAAVAARRKQHCLAPTRARSQHLTSPPPPNMPSSLLPTTSGGLHVGPSPPRPRRRRCCQVITAAALPPTSDGVGRRAVSLAGVAAWLATTAGRE